MNRYVVIAYKPNSASSCRGHVQDRFSSDFEYSAFDTQEETIEWMAQKQAFNPEWGEASWELTLLINGEDWTDDDEHYKIESQAEARSKIIVRDRAIVAKLTKEPF